MIAAVHAAALAAASPSFPADYRPGRRRRLNFPALPSPSNFLVLSLHEKPSRPCNQTPLMLVALSNMPL
jgi:hypothetical protein